MGKYNDGSERARSELGDRLLKAFRMTVKPARVERAENFTWHHVPLHLPKRKESDPVLIAHRQKLATPDKTSGLDLYRSAVAVASQMQETPLDVSAFRIGPSVTVLLPGEPMVEFQRFSQQLLPDRFVTVAGYGDLSPGYLCTDIAYEQGGYEPSASNVAPGTEGALKAAIHAATESTS